MKRCWIFLLIAVSIHMAVLVGTLLPARKFQLTVNTGLNFPYFPKAFVERIPPALLIGGGLGYNFSSRFSVLISFDLCRFKAPPDEYIKDTSSPQYDVLANLKFTLNESRISSYLLVGLGLQISQVYCISIILGHEPLISKYILGKFLFNPGLGIQYRINDKLDAFLELDCYLSLGSGSGLAYTDFDCEIPLKLGMSYRF